MSYIQTYQVYPKVPESLSFAEKIVLNLWWTWNLDAIELLRRIDAKIWNRSGRNPINFFTMIPQKQLEAISHDESFMAHFHRVKEAFETQVEKPSHYIESDKQVKGTIAYFSMEYGIHECLPLYAGGLGMLAGDHLKASSDRGEPMVAVGLLYRKGYFRQYMDQNGWQQEDYPETDLFQLPIDRAKDKEGNDLYINIAGPDGFLYVQVFKVMVGRIPLILLDTNVRENPPEKRNITSRLYVADAKIRLAQEVILGIGGMRALDAMGIHPEVCHLNEGHCSFVGVERLAQIMRRHAIDLHAAHEIIPRATVFTTHTPVAAGHDEFPMDMVVPYLKPYEKEFGIPLNDILGWGKIGPNGDHGHFSMFGLGLRMARYLNGVSELHGKVARKMWNSVWPALPEDEVPIGHITNGVHVPSWISIENSMLFDRYLGPNWHLKTWRKPEVIERLNDIYDEELWRAHEMSRARLIRTCRNLMVTQYGRRNAPKAIMEGAAAVLDHDALTIGFARRFATYKRAYLLMRDPERFEAMLTSKDHPVQIIMAGKAHPRDNEGKEVIRSLIEFARREKIRHRFIFLEDYDPYIARHLIQGCDIWLNTPRRPLEACGTSGIKAAANGVLNVSILDGWWCEGYSPETGWKIGNGEEYHDHEYQDDVESQALYNVLENEVIPCFYDRKNGDTPDKWIKKMKASMKMVLSRFCAHGMVGKYAVSYQEAVEQFEKLLADNAQEAHKLKELHHRLKTEWHAIQVAHPVRNLDGPFRVGDEFKITTSVFLGNLTPNDVEVELCYGKMKTVEHLDTIQIEKMDVMEDHGNGHFVYGCVLPCNISGRFGLTCRITPKGDKMLKYAPGLITWA